MASMAGIVGLGLVFYMLLGLGSTITIFMIVVIITGTIVSVIVIIITSIITFSAGFLF